MSVYLTPVTFAGQHIAPSDDGAAWAACTTDGISSGCTLSRSGSTLTMAAGKIIAAGRSARVDTAQTFSLANSGFDRLVLTIDLSKTIDKQVALDIEHAASLAGFSALTQDDINVSGTKYQFVICIIDDSEADILWKCARAHSKGWGTSVTIAAADWSSKTATKYVDGVTASMNVIVASDPANIVAWEAAGVYAFSQADGTLTFKCETTPSAALTANVLLY